ncbi:MAG: SusC/RagA family TonB-linked outer membrane protein [Bacteroidales bacterium]|nr:SusC/RagA family TonB-linked outer membrane protein [Bacteroidales bacterium]
MRLTILLMLVCLQLSAAMVGQNVSLTANNASLKEVLKEINDQTGYGFILPDDLLMKAGLITIDIRDLPVESALEMCLAKLPVDYEIVNNTIRLIPREELPAATEVTQEQKTIKLTGTVRDKEGIPLQGVAVIVMGTTIGASTDENGNFVLDAPTDAKALFISHLGMIQQEVNIGTKREFNISLEEDALPVDEVQVIGYGTTTRRLSTSAISSVKSEVLEKQSVSNPMEALQGRASGLYITNTAGSFGAQPTVQIRGVGTLITSGVPGGNAPLYVLDGAIIPSTGIVASPTGGTLNAVLGNYWGSEGGMNPFNFLNPSDIESIEILKDADATSIYGSRGTNGVIIITTKKGKVEPTKFNIDFNTGTIMASSLPDRLTTAQYLQMRTDAFAMGNPTTANAVNPITPSASTAPDLLTWPQDTYTDWEKFEYGNPARSYNLQASSSGGSREMNFRTSLGYSRNEEFTRGDAFQQRLSGLVNLNHASKGNRMKISWSNNISMDKLKPSHGAVSFPASLRRLPPNMPVVNEDGTPFWPTTALSSNASGFLTNPYAGDFVNAESKTFSYIGNINASYKLFDFLTLKLQAGYTNQLNSSFTANPSTSINPFIASALTPTRSESESNFETINIEPLLNFNTSIGKGIFTGLIGTTFFERTNKTFGIQISGFETDQLLGSWAGGSTVSSKSSTLFKYRFNSVFARANYAYDGRYLVNATYRRDGSSRFGPENKWANFASIGLGWIFTGESFLKDNDILSYGKIRGSYGTTGNDNIPDFRFTSLFTSTSIIYGDLIGLAPSFLSIPGFKWELTKKLDFALELGFLNDRFLLNVNWFRNLSTDLLVDQRIPTQVGFSSYLGNFPGVIENKGWEFELVTNNLGPNSKFKWKTNFNLSLLKNILLEYPDLENSPNSTRYRLGEAIPNPAFPSNLIRTLISEGVDPETGLPIYKDVNEDGTISISGNNDKDFVGSTFPAYYGGLSNTFSYKGFTLDVFIYFAKQKTTNHLYLAPTVGQLYNPVADYVGNYWTQPGDDAKYPRLWTGVGSQNTLLSNYYSSSAAIEDVFFSKLRNLSISYQFPAEWLPAEYINGLRIYGRGQNLFTYSSKELYKDPETINPRGITPKIFMFGLEVSF